MSSKVSVLPTIRAHFQTLRDDTTSTVHRPDLAIFFGLPVVAGGVVAVKRVRLQDVSSYLGGLAVFTALLFGLVIFVFQLRLQLQDRDDQLRRRSQEELIDQLFYNVNYSVLLGILTTTVGVVAASTADGDRGAPVWVSALLVTLASHLLLTIFMCIKRVHASYSTVIDERTVRR